MISSGFKQFINQHVTVDFGPELSFSPPDFVVQETSLNLEFGWYFPDTLACEKFLELCVARVAASCVYRVSLGQG